jgi:GAF domain-containing protein
LQVHVARDEVEVLRGLLDVGTKLTLIQDPRRMLDTILEEARSLMRAEAGTLYILRDDWLRLVAAQNDRLSDADITASLIDQEIPLSQESLAGFVASTGETMNIPDAWVLPKGVPFRVDHDFDAATGYRTQSILCLPLKCPDGKCIGVLQLVNCIGLGGRIVPFGNVERSGILSLASMAAVTIHNLLLQEQLKEAHLDTIIRLSTAAEYRVEGMADHIRRISFISAILAQGLGLNDRRVELIRYASPMHDVGKIGIPDAILRKSEPLTAQERRVMEQHTVIGGEILEGAKTELMLLARELALSHHERWDGKGYPYKLSGEDIPVSGRIVGLVDVFDALVSKRSYKPAYPLKKSLGIIRQERGRHFAPEVHDAFFDGLDEIVEAYDVFRNGPAESADGE